METLLPTDWATERADQRATCSTLCCRGFCIAEQPDMMTLQLFKSPSYVSPDSNGFYDFFIHTNTDENGGTYIHKAFNHDSKPLGTISTPKNHAFVAWPTPPMEDLGLWLIPRMFHIKGFSVYQPTFPDKMLGLCPLSVNPSVKKIFDINREKPNTYLGRRFCSFAGFVPPLVEYSSVQFNITSLPRSLKCSESPADHMKDRHRTLVSILQRGPLHTGLWDKGLTNDTANTGLRPNQRLLEQCPLHSVGSCKVSWLDECPCSFDNHKINTGAVFSSELNKSKSLLYDEYQEVTKSSPVADFLGRKPKDTNKSKNDNIDDSGFPESTTTSSCCTCVDQPFDAPSSESMLEKPNNKVKDVTHQVRRGRKLMNPQRGAIAGDPAFRGATIWFQTKFTGAKTKLEMSAFYSKIHTRPIHRYWDGFDSRYGSDFQTRAKDNYSVSTKDMKICASCKTRRTPLWRDSEDGTPLCNACGIRYKKYRLRCSRCWHIPKKDIKSFPNCPRCASLLRKHDSERILSST